MKGDDPRRLADPESEASDELRSLLTAARQDRPDPARIAAMASALGVPGPPGGGGGGGQAGPSPSGAGPAASAPSTGAHAAAWAKLLAGGVVAAALVGGALALWPRGDPATPAPRPAAPSGIAPDPAPRADSPAVEDEGRGAPLPSPPEAAEEDPASEEPRVAAAPSRRARDAGPPDPRDELRLLQQAQALVRTEPGAALGLVRQHRALFPSSGLAQEREVLEIEALCRLGRPGAARAGAERFGRRWPGSMHLRRVQRLIADAGPPDPAAPPGDRAEAAE